MDCWFLKVNEGRNLIQPSFDGAVAFIPYFFGNVSGEFGTSPKHLSQLTAHNNGRKVSHCGGIAPYKTDFAKSELWL